MNILKRKPVIPSENVSKVAIAVSALVSLVYFLWWFQPENVGNPVLYYSLFFGEIYHFGMVLLFLMTIWPVMRKQHLIGKRDQPEPSVAIFITVAGEPVDVVRKTARAAKAQHYTNHTVYILNDGYVGKKENWQEIERLADELGVTCITRKVGGGAKAGNINHALRQTESDLVVIFDADMVSYPEFLSVITPYFQDERMGFVQTPQYYANHEKNTITGGAWEQQSLFFGPIMEGKNRWNSAFICGTNVAIRREALVAVGGMTENNIAEDFLTSLRIHEKGWKSHYLKEVFAEGLAPEDLSSYYKQQLRWANGNLEALVTENPLFKRGLTWGQKLQYISSSLYYCNGVIVLIDAVMPLLFLFFGLQPVAATTTSFALFFLPFMFFNLYLLYWSSGNSVTFRAIAFSQSSWTLQIQALLSVILRRKRGFAVTAKKGLSGNFVHLAYPHIAYFILAVIASIIAVTREGLNPSVVTNIAWVIFNLVMFLPFISAAYRGTEREEEKEVPVPARHVTVQI